MTLELRTSDISGELILLGTGTSVGVPTIGCGCPVCTSDDPKNNRTRTSAILGLPGGNLLIDTSPDLRQQLLREKIGLVHAVLYTHEHADHVFGLDDLRLMQFYLKGPVPLFCEERVEQRIRTSFDYAFKELPNMHAGAAPKLAFRRIGLDPFDALGAKVTPIRLEHGPNFQTLGFRIGGVAYCTDVSFISEQSMDLLQGLDVLILDALRPEGHSTHFSLDQAVDVATRLAPRRTFFTHMAHGLDYESTNAILPSGMALGYDGLRIPLSLGLS
ncbi:Phosphoribosyl 1,2-cyclic phosphodiesterase [Pirellulimonas nuda]|uniref:Phosphoribosyl 1,2-cyclic phosphodiesterase n=1 Tax=Pirellulimonas nuda TaxID=2528009 RepID=A0A518D9K2_9BACT|nr:MBL fold metallo-hydrolase [Pirellulimonas nuda]QDU88165.1 Phosphoribosyl 1,2-cyclic phosphodiesterase [Pirellulimonas nuda]